MCPIWDTLLILSDNLIDKIYEVNKMENEFVDFPLREWKLSKIGAAPRCQFCDKELDEQEETNLCFKCEDSHNEAVHEQMLEDLGLN